MREEALEVRATRQSLGCRGGSRATQKAIPAKLACGFTYGFFLAIVAGRGQSKPHGEMIGAG